MQFISFTYLREDVDWLVAWTTETMSQDMTGITVLHTIIIKRSGVILSARSGVRAMIQVFRGDSNADGRHDRNTIVENVVIGSLCSTA